MTKLILHFAFITLSPIAMSAQIITYVNFGGGLSTFSTEFDDLTLVPSVGLSLKAYEKNGLSIAPGLLYQQRAQNSNVSPDVSISLRMHTINVEFPLEYKAPVGVTFNLGYYYSLPLYSAAGITANGETVREKVVLGDDAGAMAGIGFSADKWAVKVTYKHGLNPVDDRAYGRAFFLQFLWAIHKSDYHP